MRRILVLKGSFFDAYGVITITRRKGSDLKKQLRNNTVRMLLYEDSTVPTHK